MCLYALKKKGCISSGRGIQNEYEYLTLGIVNSFGSKNKMQIYGVHSNGININWAQITQDKSGPFKLYQRPGIWACIINFECIALIPRAYFRSRIAIVLLVLIDSK